MVSYTLDLVSNSEDWFMMQFCFVDCNSTLGADHARKEIRNHVMKGKNAGRVIAARGWKKRRRQTTESGQERAKKRSGTRTTEVSSDLPRKTAHTSHATAWSTVSEPSPFSIMAGIEWECFDCLVEITPAMRSMIYECMSVCFLHAASVACD